MPALETLVGLRVVAAPAALDSARWSGDDVVVLRFASDEAFAIGATAVELDDPDAIVEDEHGFAGARLDGLDDVSAHIDWRIPDAPGTLVQGKVAGVPAKLLIGERPLLVTNSAYADELEGRLGWR